MGILNSRRFVTLQTNAPSIEDVNKAETLLNLDEILEAQRNIRKYEFSRNKELENKLDNSGFVSVHWWVEMDKNGKAVQRAELLDSKGNTAQCRLYGTEKELQKEDTKPLANFACGWCKSGDILVTDLMNIKGTLYNVPRTYVNIAMKRS